MKIVRKTHLVQRYFAALVMAIAGLLAPVVWASETQSMGYDLSSTELMAQQSNGVVIVDIRRNEERKIPGLPMVPRLLPHLQKQVHCIQIFR